MTVGSVGSVVVVVGVVLVDLGVGVVGSCVVVGVGLVGCSGAVRTIGRTMAVTAKSVTTQATNTLAHNGGFFDPLNKLILICCLRS